MSAEVPDLEDLRELAGNTYWQRGEVYFAQGKVKLLRWDTVCASAQVRGTERYSVDLRYVARNQETWACSCSCPLGEDDEYCKHIVAAALAWTEALGEPIPVTKTERRKPRSAAKAPADKRPEDLAAFVRAQPAEALAAQLMEIADRHKDVHRELLFWMRSSQTDTPQNLRKALSTLIGSPGLLDWKGSNAFAQRIDQVHAQLERLLASDAAQAAEGCEYALSRLLKIYARSDDSGGAIGGSLSELAQLHARCCAAARTDASRLAAKLLRLQLADDWGFFPVSNYRDALGKRGLDAYGTALQRQWDALAPSGNDPHQLDYLRFGITRLMEQYLEARDDVDGLLKVKMADLSNANRYADLIDCCLRYGREKAALDWAERGVKTYTNDESLRTTLASFYERDGLDEDALKLRWQSFEQYPAAQQFMALKKAAGKDWATWRNQALQLAKTRERAIVGKPQHRGAPPPAPYVELRLQLLLAEDSVDEALALVATGLADPRSLETLARRSEADHPAAAIELYERIIAPALAQRTGRYDDIVDWIRRRARLAGPERASRYEDDIRLKYRHKRNLIKALDEAPKRKA